jgi:F420-dependent oxidoreductase-like protein
MRLGLNLGTGGPAPLAETIDLVREAERLGYSVVWTSEAYGADAATVLGWLAGQTSTIDLGSAVLQIPARSAAMTAMTAATLDVLCGGRFRLGLGVSGPQVSEGWHGVRFDRPLARTREYVDVVRLALARQNVAYEGEFVTLPLPEGPGRPLRLSMRTARDRVPLYLAAVGPKNVELTGEIADGWLGVFASSETISDTLASLRAGAARGGHELAPDFDIVLSVAAAVGPDVATAARAVRPFAALYVGGMGSRSTNFYAQQARRMGYAAEVDTVQELYLGGSPRDAAEALPVDFLNATSLLGPSENLQGRLRAYAEAGVTTLSVTPFATPEADRTEVLRRVADALAAVQ